MLWAMDAREAFRETPRGIGLYQRHLIREFPPLSGGARFLLYHQRPRPASMPEPGPSFRARRIDMPGDRWHLWELLRLPLALLRDRPAVYHGTCNTLPPLLPCPGVVTLHDVIVLWWEGDPPDGYVRHCRRVTARTVRQAKVVLTVSEYSRREILARFDIPPERVRVFHNGIPPHFQGDPSAQEVADARARLGLQGPYLFAIGSPLARKNTAGLIRAAGLLERNGSLGREVAVSGLAAAERPPFAALAREVGLGGRLRFLPYMDATTLRAVYAGAELFVYPSHAEGWGIPVLEAMAVGTPVACSATTAIPEAGGEFPAYFDPAESASMAAAIRESLAGREAWAARREAARARARTFTWSGAARTTLEAYREAAGVRRG